MRLRVLIVEDSEDDAELLVLALERGGVEADWRRVDTASEMLEALDSAVWDVILSDHSMPQFTALGALAVLKQTGLDIPFIIVSGAIGEDIAIEAMKAGAHDYMMKGKLGRLVPAIERELREAQVRRERRQAGEALRTAYAELERRVEQRTAELARAHEELRRRQEADIAALKELDHQKDEFLAIVAHELRTPLTSVKGFTQLLLKRAERLSKGDDWVRPLAIVDGQVNRLADIIDLLLDLSRIQVGRLELQPEPVDLLELVRGAVEEAQVTSSRHAFSVWAEAAEVMCVCDRRRIAQVLANLLSNAIKYSAKGGRVEAAVIRRGDEAVVSVRDEGIGIPAAALERLFDRYFRTPEAVRSRVDGLGLGLYVANGIIAAHEGRFMVESEEGSGSCFSFALPIGAARVTRRAPKRRRDARRDARLTV